MRQLKQLETQLDSMPDAVRLALDSIPLATLRGEARALYAILKTQADYKCYEPLTTDTLIRYATDYYDGNKKDRRAAMAWYSLGCVYTEQNNDVDAIGAYLRAKTLFSDTTVRYHALCNHNLGRHYLNREMYDDALCSFRSCKQQSVMLGDSSTVGYCDYYMGCAYLYQELYDNARFYFSQVELNAQAPQICKLRLAAQEAKIAIYKDYDYPKAQYLLLKSIQNNDDIGAHLSLLATVHESMCQYDSAYYYARNVLLCPHEIHTQCWNYKRLAQLSSLVGLHDSTSFYIERYTLLLDSIYRLRQQEEINDIRNDLTISLYRQQQVRERFFYNIAGFFVFVTAMLCVWLLFNKRENRLLKRNLQLNSELAQIRAALLYGVSKEGNHTEPSPLSAEEINAYYSQLYDMCYEQYRLTASYTLMQSPPSDINKLQRESIIMDIRSSFADIISAIHSATPNLSADILLTCVCLSLGYTTDTIVSLFVISPQTVRSRKSRAKQELSTPIFNLLCSTHAEAKAKKWQQQPFR